jgi:peptidoglycan/LPS O-acetylase OafA/YrhL
VSVGQVEQQSLPHGHRPFLDGLRGLAVAMVVAQHTLGEIPIDLGGVGVGVFFALSGYLITSLLMDERASRGTVHLRGFYLRRAARLTPALLLVVAVCNVLFLLVGDLEPVKGSVFALTYTANYALVLDPSSVRGYGPTWSLAVEEHFYVVWPLALLWVLRRRDLQTAVRWTLAACLATLVWRCTAAALGAPLSLLAIGSVERADALLYGCTAALALRLGRRPPVRAVGAGAALVLAMVLLPLAGLPDRLTYATSTTVLAVGAAALVVGLDAGSGDRQVLRGLLSTPLLVRLGVLSYGLYLWHGPLMRVFREVGLSGRGWRAVAVVVAVAAAAASYRWVERPVRDWARRASERPAEAPAVPDPAPAVTEARNSNSP